MLFQIPRLISNYLVSKEYILMFIYPRMSLGINCRKHSPKQEDKNGTKISL